MEPIQGLNYVEPFAKKTVTINLAASSVIDPARMLASARNLSHSSCYHRYGSTVEFYIPNMYLYRFVNDAAGNGLDVTV